MTVQIEEGKFYRSRYGERMGPMRPSFQQASHPWTYDGIRYTHDGHWFIDGKRHPFDLVAEWVDKPAPPFGLGAARAHLESATPFMTPQQAADRELADYQDERRNAEWDEDLIRRLSVAKNREAVYAPVGMSNATLAAHVEETRRRVHAGQQNGVLFSDNAPGEQRQQKAEPGWKMDAGKARLDLIAPEMLDGIADILAFGAARYGERNWEKGMSWGRPFGAMMRHMWAWWRGEQADAETGKSHLWHAACCLMFLIAYEARRVGTDDRAKILQPVVDGASEV